MKKTIPFIFLLAFVFLLSGCGSLSDTPDAASGDIMRCGDIGDNGAAISGLYDGGDESTAAAETLQDADGEGVAVRVTKASADGLTLELCNNTGADFIYGSDFRLDQKTGGAWQAVPVTAEGNYGFDDIAYVVEAGKTGEWTADWTWLYGSLEPGDYRIVKSVVNGPDGLEEIMAEFTVEG